VIPVYVAIAALLVALRWVGLDAYPPAMPDEGFWACGPRNWVLFGSPLMDGRLHSFLSPATFAALSGWFALVTPSLVAARWFSVVTGLLSCCAMAVIGRREFRERPWLPILLYGASGLALFVDRSILLESHQILWLLLAATLWLGATPRSVRLAGAAFGVALLVKSNSLYLVPAYWLSSPSGPASDGKRSAFPSFLITALAVAACGYAVAYALDPAAFVTAFSYELDGAHLATRHVLFRYGRAGLNPHLLGITAREVLFTDPFVTLLGIGGMITVFTRVGVARPADRLFACWAGLGLVSNLIQIYPQYRYVITTTPALAFLGARIVDRLAERGWRAAAGVVVACFLAYQVGELHRFVSERPTRSYWQLVNWIRDNVPADANVLAAPYIGISLPNRSYDFAPFLYGYGITPRSLQSVIDENAISRVVADGQWNKYQKPEMKAFLAANCSVEGTVASFRVFVCGLWR